MDFYVVYYIKNGSYTEKLCYLKFTSSLQLGHNLPVVGQVSLNTACKRSILPSGVQMNYQM